MSNTKLESNTQTDSLLSRYAQRNEKAERELEQLTQELANADQNPTQNNNTDLANQNVVNEPATSEEDLTYKKRWSDLKNHYDRTVRQERDRIKELEDRLQEVTANVNGAPKTKEELEAFSKSNPEAYNAMKAMLMETTGGAQSTERLKKLEEELMKSKQEKAITEITSRHPDFIEIISSKEWNEWLKDQPTNIVNMVEGNVDDAKSFISAINLYKLEVQGNQASNGNSTNTLSATENSSASAAYGVNVRSGKTEQPSSGARIWTVAEIERMPLSVYEQHSEEILLAQREGRVR